MFIQSERHYFSIQHVLAAAKFARLSAVMECSDSIFSVERLSEQMAYVTGSVISSVAFLEAVVNEVCADAADGTVNMGGLNAGDRQKIGKLWKLEKFNRTSVLDKFQKVLHVAGAPMLVHGTAPYQDVSVLVKLRNILVHYKLGWTTGEVDERENVRKLNEQLRSKFQLNRLAPEGASFFPEKCLGHGCASWAVDSVREFADEFYARMGLTPTYDHVRARLHTS